MSGRDKLQGLGKYGPQMVQTQDLGFSARACRDD